MADEVRDALMKFTINGVAVSGESMAVVADDDMAKDFKSATKETNYISNFFQLKTFKMDMGLLADSAKDPEDENKQLKAQITLMKESMKENEDGIKLASTRSASDFTGFMNGTIAAGRAYSSNLESVVITKILDMSSLALFQACTKSTTIDSASLIKRRGVGGKQLSTYLRIDFRSLLITDFNWDEDDVITEKISFVCRSATVKYRYQQGAHGKALEWSPVLPDQSWSVANLK